MDKVGYRLRLHYYKRTSLLKRCCDGSLRINKHPGERGGARYSQKSPTPQSTARGDQAFGAAAWAYQAFGRIVASYHHSSNLHQIRCLYF